MTEYSGKIAFITGGASGAGFGQATVFAEAGCKIAIADIRGRDRGSGLEAPRAGSRSARD